MIIFIADYIGVPIVNPEEPDKCNAGSVTLDGIDLDVEADGFNMSNKTAEIVALINAIHKYAPNKLLLFTGISVGADPVAPYDVNKPLDTCTTYEHVHCGEFRDIISQTKNELNWVNLMAYDAGQEYATSKYQISMKHLADLVGTNKSVLGLDIQSQWGMSAPETPEQLGAKAKWAKASGFGSMFWAIGNYGDTKSYLKSISNNMQ